MSQMSDKKVRAARRTHRVRSRFSGRPRLSVHISNLNVTAQIIDDNQGKTLAYASTVGNKEAAGNLTQKASFIGKLIGQKAKKAKVAQVAFDRGSQKYHGRMKALAEAARAEGLEF